jgi:hypothetical protein
MSDSIKITLILAAAFLLASASGFISAPTTHAFVMAALQFYAHTVCHNQIETLQTANGNLCRASYNESCRLSYSERACLDVTDPRFHRPSLC